MATDGDGDKRHVWGPRAVGALVPGLTRPAFRRRAPATAQVLADWSDIVGPALAAVTAPRRMSGLTLTLACSGPIAMELQHMSEELVSRINSHMGRTVVQRLKFVQELLPPQATPAPVLLSDEPPPPIPGIPAGPLHDALARLGQALQRHPGRRR
jgi:hypothetical protein